MLWPRLTTTERNALTPIEGMVIFNSTTGLHEGYFGSAWSPFGLASSIEGVSNPGGNIDFVPTDGLDITGNDGSDTITFGMGVITPDAINMGGLGDIYNVDYIHGGTSSTPNGNDPYIRFGTTLDLL